MALSDTLHDLAEDIGHHVEDIKQYLDPNYPIDYRICQPMIGRLLNSLIVVRDLADDIRRPLDALPNS